MKEIQVLNRKPQRFQTLSLPPATSNQGKKTKDDYEIGKRKATQNVEQCRAQERLKESKVQHPNFI